MSFLQHTSLPLSVLFLLTLDIPSLLFFLFPPLPPPLPFFLSLLPLLLLLSLSLAILLFCSRYTVSYIYLTLSLKMKDLGIDNYFRQVIPGIMEVPARLSCVVLLEYFGRKCSLYLSLTLATVFCLFLLFLPQGTTCQEGCLQTSHFFKFSLVSLILAGQLSTHKLTSCMYHLPSPRKPQPPRQHVPTFRGPRDKLRLSK